jgi:hypothetical protein
LSWANCFTGTSRARLPSMPTNDTCQACTGVGTIIVGDRQPLREVPSLITWLPTVILPIRQPPSLTAPSVT